MGKKIKREVRQMVNKKDIGKIVVTRRRVGRLHQVKDGMAIVEMNYMYLVEFPQGEVRLLSPKKTKANFKKKVKNLSK